jgi:ankyrin repeat protein
MNKRNKNLMQITIIFFSVLSVFLSSVEANEDFLNTVAKGKVQVIKELLDQGADINFVNKDRLNALQIAVVNNNFTVLNLLLESNINLEHQDKEGRTALEYLAKPNLINNLRKALQGNVNLKQKNRQLLSIGGVCIVEKNIACLESLLNQNFPVNSKEGYLQLPILQLAFINNMDRIVRLLLEKGANPNLTDNRGNTFYHLLAEKGDTKTLSLIENPYLDQKNDDGDTPLYISLSKQNFSFALTLLNLNASPTIANLQGITPYHLAASMPNKEVLKKIIPKIIDINDLDLKNDSPLIYAIRNKMGENVKILLEEGANPELLGSGKLPPIAMAVELNHFDICKFLLEKNVNVNYFFPNGKHLLHHVIEQDNLRILKLFLEKFDSDRINLLHFASSQGKLPVAELLIKSGADIELANRHGETPIFKAVLNGRTKLLQYFLNQGVNINKLNNYGESLIHYAVKTKQKEILELLINKGINLKVLDRDGNNLIHQFVSATEREDDVVFLLKIVPLLTNRGVQINEKNSLGITPLWKAIENGNSELITGLLQNGSDINEPNPDNELILNNSVLSYLNSEETKSSELNQIKTYLKFGANPNLFNRFKRNLLSEVLIRCKSTKGNKCEKVVQVLQENGARIHGPDLDGNTTIQYAKNTNNSEIINLIEKASKGKDLSYSKNEWSNVQYGTSSKDEGLSLDTNKHGIHLILGSFGTERKMILLNSRGIAVGQMNYEGARSAVFDSSGNIFIAGITEEKQDKFLNFCKEGKLKLPYVFKVDSNGSELNQLYLERNKSCQNIEIGPIFFSQNALTVFIPNDNQVIQVGNDGKVKWSTNIASGVKRMKAGIDGNLFFLADKPYILDNKSRITSPKNLQNDKLLDFYVTKNSQTYAVFENDGLQKGAVRLEKYDSKGRILWNRIFSSGNLDKFHQMKVDDQENVYLIGLTEGNMHGNKRISEMETDIFLIKLDSDGKRLWTTQLGSDGEDQVNSFQITQDNNIVILATSNGKVEGGSHQGEEDITIFKLNEDGDPF